METKLWFGRKITYDPDKYTLKANELGVAVVEKLTEKKLFSTYTPIMIKQINDNEFVASSKKNKGTGNNRYLFRHFYYDEKNKTVKLIYQKEYEPKKVINTELKNIEDVYFLEGFSKTTLYNSKERKSLTLLNSNISPELYLDEQGNKYIEVTEKVISHEYSTTIADYLKMFIKLNTLEFDGFYSTLQDRYIPIPKEKNFKADYASTITREVIHYIDLLEARERYYQEQNNKEAASKLVKKRQLTKVESE